MLNTLPVHPYSYQADPRLNTQIDEAQKACKYLFDRTNGLKKLEWGLFIQALYKEEWITSCKEGGKSLKAFKIGIISGERRVPTPEAMDSVNEGEAAQGGPSSLRALLVSDNKTLFLNIGILQTEPDRVMPKDRSYFTLKLDREEPETSLRKVLFYSLIGDAGTFQLIGNAPLGPKCSVKDLQSHVAYAYYYTMYKHFPTEDVDVFTFQPPTPSLLLYSIPSNLLQECQILLQNCMEGYTFLARDRCQSIPVNFSSTVNPCSIQEVLRNLPYGIHENLRNIITRVTGTNLQVFKGALTVGTVDPTLRKWFLEVVPCEGSPPLIEAHYIGARTYGTYQPSEGKLDMELPIESGVRVLFLIGRTQRKNWDALSMLNFMLQKFCIRYSYYGLLILVKTITLETSLLRSIQEQSLDCARQMQIEEAFS